VRRDLQELKVGHESRGFEIDEVTSDAVVRVFAVSDGGC
jgi:hypothetical protein